MASLPYRRLAAVSQQQACHASMNETSTTKMSYEDRPTPAIAGIVSFIFLLGGLSRYLSLARSPSSARKNWRTAASDPPNTRLGRTHANCFVR